MAWCVYLYSLAFDAGFRRCNTTFCVLDALSDEYQWCYSGVWNVELLVLKSGTTNAPRQHL